MFLGRKQDLNGLPAHKSFQRQGRDRRLFEVVPGRLEGMLAAENLPNVGYRFVWGVDKQFCATGDKAVRS